MSEALSDGAAPAPGRTRRNRGSEVVRHALVSAAIEEFSAHGFEGASTRRIAEAAGAHQSQIKYHFDGKDELWKQCLRRLVAEVDDAIAEALGKADSPTGDLAVVEAVIRGLVRFASRRPELSRIMMHEATSPSERLAWLVEHETGERRRTIVTLWEGLRAKGLVAPVDGEALYHTAIGASSLLYANAPEAVLMGIDPSSPDVIERHADALVAMFIPSARPTR
ncbi:MAG: TetR/AcrR family transcriptional regulator [Actinomycetota bacterium]